LKLTAIKLKLFDVAEQQLCVYGGALHADDRTNQRLPKNVLRSRPHVVVSNSQCTECRTTNHTFL